MEATVGLLEVQMPPVTVLVTAAGVPVQKVVGPESTPALAVLLTFTVCVAATVPQLPVTE